MDNERAATGAAQRDLADLQRLICYVEGWQLAQFQPPPTEADRRRQADAAALLRKLRGGLALASGQPAARSRHPGGVFLY
jgi:hypothetical protein